MNKILHLMIWSRLLGALMALFAAGSLAITGYALYLSQPLADQVTTEATSAADAAAGLLDSSVLALQATSTGLKDSQSTLKTIDQSILTIGQAVSNSFGLLETTSGLTGETLPETLSDTQQSLTSAQETARSIEAVLGVVSQVPFFPGGKYEPEVSLEFALRDAAEDLDQLFPALEEITVSLGETHTNMTEVENDIIDIIIQLRKTEEHLNDAELVVSTYQSQVAAMDADLANFNAGIPGRVTMALWFVRFILLWVAIGQAAMLLYGVKLVFAVPARQNPTPTS